MTSKKTAARPAAARTERPVMAVVERPAVKATQRHGFKINEYIVYPAHGVGQILSIEEQEVAGYKLELFVISFLKDKMTLRVPVSKIATVGMRKLAEGGLVKRDPPADHKEWEGKPDKLKLFDPEPGEGD